MISRLRLASFFLLVLIAASFAQAQLSKRIVADYGYWSKYNKVPYAAAQIPYNEVTHINHAGVGFDATGTLSVPDGFLEPDLITNAHAAGVKVMLLLGGDFPGLEASGMAQTLVDNVAAFEQQYGYDGADIDWEYPATTGDRIFLDKLMALFRKSNANYTLSIDVAPWGGYGYDTKVLQTSLDYFNIMMFDCAGPWTAHGQLNSPIFWDFHNPAPYECQPGGSAAGTADIFLSTVPPQQLNMGMPFYGYYYTNINQLFEQCPNSYWTDDQACDYMVQTQNYGTFFKNLINKRGWKTYRDPIAFVPYMLKADGSDGFITYDDAFSTYYRTVYSDWTRGFGGTFMWSLDADYDGHSQDLLTAMYQGARNGK
ncbi:MAG TPA: glycoside hydrolase family 18 protein [Candidatus Solibacter sp.]|nr:glycoside hydrolase family 18 protein [Candidatus Solibacter sp.]